MMGLGLRSSFAITRRSLRIGGIAAGIAVAGPVAGAATLNLDDYRLTFDESFRTLDISARGPDTRWTAHTPWNGDFGDARFEDPGPLGPFSIDPQGLTITAVKDSSGKWHAGLICSMDRDGSGQHGFAQRYGYFEMKAKLPEGPGTWPAFWLVGTDKTTASSEIDVLEYYGHDLAHFYSTEHLWKDGKDLYDLHRATAVTPHVLSGGYNTFGVDITAETTTFYFNRGPIWMTPTPVEYRQPMYILANLALGGGWPISDLSSPLTMSIAYIKVYQRKTVDPGSTAK